MALNFPGPYGMRIFYTTTPVGFQPMTHKLELNCDASGDPEVGSDFAEISLVRRGGTSVTAEVAVLGFVEAVKPMMAANTDFVIAELWRYAPDSFDATFIAAYSLGIVGTGAPASAALAGLQTVFTFRTAEGGIAKFSLMEPNIAPGARQSYPTGVAAANTAFLYVTSPTTWILGRDTSYVRVPLNFLPGQNEALFKRRFRS